MAITKTAMLTKFNNLVGDNITGTTTTNGSANKDTFIDTAMDKYDEGYFGGNDRNVEWWAYIASELRAIKQFSEGGIFQVFEAFTNQVAASTAYELHRFNRNNKANAINTALVECYPSFYNRVTDATTLDGKGASDNQYQVPSTFAEFPDEIWQKKTSGSLYTWTRITDFKAKNVGGTWYFYADITSGDDILLVGKKPLTKFTSTESSTTELTDAEADVVCLLAASIFFRTVAGIINAEDSGRYHSLSEQYKDDYERALRGLAMPQMTNPEPNWDWAD